MRRRVNRSLSSADKPLMIIFFSLVVFGLVMIFSAGAPLALNKYGELTYFFFHQLFYGVIPGLVLWAIVQNIPYKFWEKVAFPLFMVILILLVSVLIVGETYKGSTSWIDLGPFNLQPTELAKLILIIYLAAWLSKREDKMESFFLGFLPFCFILVVLAALIASQPDIGTLGMISIIAISIYFLAKGKLSHIFLLFLMGIVTLALMIQIAPYRMARFKAFVNTEADLTGIGWQIYQAKIAIGSGGFLGNGLGEGRQKFLYLPEPIGDSIFAIICEELGMIGGVVLIALFVLMAWRGYRIVKNAPDTFAKLLAGGITSWFVLQAFINIGAITALIPLTGIPLPFVSYGSSALIVSLVAAGILLNISRYCD